MDISYQYLLSVDRVKHIQSIITCLIFFISFFSIAVLVITYLRFSSAYYFNGIFVKYEVTNAEDPLVMNVTAENFGNASIKSCWEGDTNVTTDRLPIIIYDTTDMYPLLKTQKQLTFTCLEKNYMFAILQYILLYLPSSNIVSCLYGPSVTSFLTSAWGFFMAFSGAILWISKNTPELRVVSIFLGIMGVYLIVNGNLLEQQDKQREKILTPKFLIKAILFPILMAFSPIIYVVFRIIILVRPNNYLINHQVMFSNFPLQDALSASYTFYIAFLHLQDIATINAVEQITSKALFMFDLPFALTVCTRMIEKYIRYRTGSTDMPNMLNLFKYYPMFFFNSIFRVSSMAIIIYYFHYFSFFIFLAYIWIFWRFSRYTRLLNNLEDEYQMDLSKQYTEALLLNSFTLTNLHTTRCARLFRKHSFYYNLIAVSVILGSMLYMGNNGPHRFQIPFSENEPSGLFIVNKVSYLNTIIAGILGCGFMSWLLDIAFSMCNMSFFHEK